MQVRTGERVKVVGHTVGAAERVGTVVEVRRSGSMVVAWDGGQESLVFPGSDMRVVDEDDESSSREPASLLGCHIDLRLRETDDHCEAVATLMTRRGSFQATGVSRRNPSDPKIPMVGEELAIARALQSLGDQLETEAQDIIDLRILDGGHLI